MKKKDRGSFVDVTFLVEMELVRSPVSLAVPDAFAAVHYLSKYGEVGYVSDAALCMQSVIERWLWRHGFPLSADILCAGAERQVSELACCTSGQVVLIGRVHSLFWILEALRRLRQVCWSLYETLIRRLSIVAYSSDRNVLPLAPLPVIVLPSWRQVGNVVGTLGLTRGATGYVPVVKPMREEAVSL